MRLARGVAIADQDAFDAIVTDDAAPKRIVQVEDQATPAFPNPCRQDPANVI